MYSYCFGEGRLQTAMNKFVQLIHTISLIPSFVKSRAVEPGNEVNTALLTSEETLTAPPSSASSFSLLSMASVKIV